MLQVKTKILDRGRCLRSASPNGAGNRSLVSLGSLFVGYWVWYFGRFAVT